MKQLLEGLKLNHKANASAKIKTSWTERAFECQVFFNNLDTARSHLVVVLQATSVSHVLYPEDERGLDFAYWMKNCDPTPTLASACRVIGKAEYALGGQRLMCFSLTFTISLNTVSSPSF